MNSKLIAGLCLSLAVLPLAAQTRDFGEGLVNLAPSRLLENHDGRSAHWSGIGRIEIKGEYSCTASLIDTRSPDSPDDAPAYLLTSGHCAEKRNGLMVTDRAVEGTVKFNFFADSEAQTFALKRVNWSSMQGVDIAIIELQASLSSVIAAGIEPIRIAETIVPEGQDILLVGAPLRPRDGYLRVAACTQQVSAQVLEQPWFWRHTVKNQCRDAMQGGSGSPLLNRTSNEMFAVMGTTTQGSTKATTIELPLGFPALSPDSNYANPVTYLRNCFVNGVLSQDPQQCPLFPTFSVDFKSAPKQHAKIGLDTEGQAIYPGWDLNFSLDTPFYRYKIVDHAIECEKPDHYSPTLPAKDARVDDAMGPHIGMQLLCIVGVTSVDERPAPGLMRNALTLAAELLAAGPTEAPRLNIKRQRNGYVVGNEFDPRLFDHYTSKMGPPQSTDCADPQGYLKSNRPRFVTPSRLPLKICTQAYDLNGQPSAVREDLLPEIPVEKERLPQGTRFSHIGLG